MSRPFLINRKVDFETTVMIMTTCAMITNMILMIMLMIIMIRSGNNNDDDNNGIMAISINITVRIMLTTTLVTMSTTVKSITSENSGKCQRKEVFSLEIKGRIHFEPTSSLRYLRIEM